MIMSQVTNAALNTRHKDLTQKPCNNRLNQTKDRIHELERIASYFRGKKYFDEDGTQNYLVFQVVYKYFEDVGVSKTIIKFHANSWISKRLSDEKNCSVSGFTSPFIEYKNSRIKLKFDGNILREKLSTSLRLIANYFIVYRLNPITNGSNIVLENCLFGKIKMTKNVDTDKYKYQGHGIGFDFSGIFSHECIHSRMYSPNFTVTNKTFWLSLHYNGDDSYLFFNVKEVIKIKAQKQSVVEKLSLGNISGDFNQAGRK